MSMFHIMRSTVSLTNETMHNRYVSAGTLVNEKAGLASRVIVVSFYYEGTYFGI